MEEKALVEYDEVNHGPLERGAVGVLECEFADRPCPLCSRELDFIPAQTAEPISEDDLDVLEVLRDHYECDLCRTYFIEAQA